MSRTRRPSPPPPKVRRRRFRGLPRWIGLVVSLLGFAGFTVFLVLRLQAGFERRAAEWFESAEEVPEEREEVVSREIEFTRFDDQGRPILRGRAEQALGRSDGRQRFVEVEVRLLDVYGGGDAVVAADELLLETRTEALEFIGNALLSVEGLELSGPHLHFRRAPDRLWSHDPVQFRTEDFVGIAASMRFDILSGDVSLRGVVASPVEEDGFSVVAQDVEFDGESHDTTLLGGVEVASDRLELLSREQVVARRDRERGRMRSLEAGFDTELRVLAAATGDAPEAAEDEDAPEAAEDEDAPETAGDGDAPETAEEADGPEIAADGYDLATLPPRLRGDALEIELEGGRTPRVIRVSENPSFEGERGAELRGGAAELRLGRDGALETLRLTGSVTSLLPVDEEGERRIRITAETLEVGFDAGADIAEAAFDGKVGGQVRAEYGGAAATADRARWDGEETLVLEGAPRVVDSALLELEGDGLRLIAAESGRVEAEGAVTARFLPERLDWLPGRFDGVVLTGDAAELETGTGRGAFTGSVRLLFGTNRLLSRELEVDANARTLRASGEVVTHLEFDPPPPPEAEIALPLADDGGADGTPVEGSVEGAAAGDIPPAAGDTPPATGDTPPAARPFAFAVRAGQFRYEAATGQMTYDGNPRLRREEPGGEVSTLSAGRIEAELAPDGSLRAVRGTREARFERGTDRVRGFRIRYEPEADILLAWGAPPGAPGGAPAVVEIEGRSSEGGRLELALRESRSDLRATRRGRAVTRVLIAAPQAEPPR